MPIGGGTYVVQNKTLPGAYINFVSANGAAGTGRKGIVSLPLSLNWGPESEIFSLSSDNFLNTALETLGYDPTSPELLLIREALKRAKTLLAYRVTSGGVKASATVGGMTVTAKYGGTRGNDIKVAVVQNVDNTDNVDVVTYLGTMEMDLQTVAKSGGAASLKPNSFVTFGAAATLTAQAATALTGGTNGTVNGAAYTAYLGKVEAEQFDVIGYPGTDTEIKGMFDAFVRRLRDEDGKKIICVMYGKSSDYIGIINVKNGVVLDDGTVVSGDKAVAWVAGATAGAEVNESLTNTAYDGAVDVDIKYTKSQYETAIKSGEFAFYAEANQARVLTDINSLTTFGANVSEDWASNRVVRVMDGWANETASIFGNQYIGKATNSNTGRELFKADLVNLGNQYMALDAITGFVSDDITIEQGSDKRSVVVLCAIQPTDAMEKLYMTVTVS